MCSTAWRRWLPRTADGQAAVGASKWVCSFCGRVGFLSLSPPPPPSPLRLPPLSPPKSHLSDHHLPFLPRVLFPSSHQSSSTPTASPCSLSARGVCSMQPQPCLWQRRHQGMPLTTRCYLPASLSSCNPLACCLRTLVVAASHASVPACTTSPASLPPRAPTSPCSSVPSAPTTWPRRWRAASLRPLRLPFAAPSAPLRARCPPPSFPPLALPPPLPSPPPFSPQRKPSSMLFCTACGVRGHPKCCQAPCPPSVAVRRGWRCLECRHCEVCAVPGCHAMLA